MHVVAVFCQQIDLSTMSHTRPMSHLAEHSNCPHSVRGPFMSCLSAAPGDVTTFVCQNNQWERQRGRPLCDRQDWTLLEADTPGQALPLSHSQSFHSLSLRFPSCSLPSLSLPLCVGLGQCREGQGVRSWRPVGAGCRESTGGVKHLRVMSGQSSWPMV